jgi:hypothetical protein
VLEGLVHRVGGKDISSEDELIIRYMPMAKKIGLKYAARNTRQPDECVAECYFLVCQLFLEQKQFYDLAENKDRLVGMYVKRRLINYFEARQCTRLPLVDKVIRNTDEEMIEWLSGLFPDSEVFGVFRLLRDGVTLYDVDLIDPLLIKVAKRIRYQVSSRIKRIERLKAMGLKPTREIEYESPLEDEQDLCETTGGDSGESEGRENPTGIAA